MLSKIFAIGIIPSESHFRRYYAMNAAIDEFLCHMKAVGRAESSVCCYRGYLEKLAQMLGAPALPDITAADLDQVLVKLREPSTLSEITLNKIRSIYRSFFLWAYSCGKIRANPASTLTLAHVTSLPTTPITASELEALFNTIRASGTDHAERDELLFTICAFTGIRKTEALALKRSDYDATTRNLSIRIAKGGRQRIQPVPMRLAKLLEHHVGCGLSGDEDNCFLFAGRQGQRHLSARQAQTLFSTWKCLSGIRSKLTIRSLRAGFATLLYRSCGDIWLVASALGHAGIQTVRHYVQADIKEVRTAVERAFLVRA
jgi:site-specific recombinase XerD